MFKHILVPTDGSQFSQDAARGAVALAKAIEARITAFYVKPEYPTSYDGEGILYDSTPPGRFSELAQQEAQEVVGYVEKLCLQAGVDCDNLTLSRDAVHEAIIEAAERCACDLIFMASHGRRGLSALLLGSETNKVLTHSKIPVLVFR